MRATIDREGRVTLGRELQSQLGLRPGDEVMIECRGGEWVIKPAKSDTGLGYEGNVLVHSGVSAEKTDWTSSDLSDERLRQLSVGLTG